jgi:hypothetical protein
MEELIKDFNKSKLELKESNNAEVLSLDIAIKSYADNILVLQKQIDSYTKSKDPKDLKAAAFTIDLMSALINETTSTIPNKDKLSTKSIDFEKLDAEDKIIMQEIMQDINKGKITKQKNILFYLKELETVDYSMKKLMTEIDQQELGFEDLSETIAGLDFDAIDVENMDLDSITATFESLEQLNIEQVTESVSESIAETSQAIQQATEQVSEILWEDFYTVNEMLDFINDELNTNVTLYQFDYLVGNLYDLSIWTGGYYTVGQNTWAEAVADYNSVNGTNLSPEEALSLSAEVICFYSNC